MTFGEASSSVRWPVVGPLTRRRVGTRRSARLGSAPRGDEKVRLLAKNSLLSGCRSADLLTLARAGELLAVLGGADLGTYRPRAHAIVVLDGMVDVEARSRVATLAAGQSLGLVDVADRTWEDGAHATAKSDATVLVGRCPKLFAALTFRPALGAIFLGGPRAQWRGAPNWRASNHRSGCVPKRGCVPAGSRPGNGSDEAESLRSRGLGLL